MRHIYVKFKYILTKNERERENFLQNVYQQQLYQQEFNMPIKASGFLDHKSSSIPGMQSQDAEQLDLGA